MNITVYSANEGVAVRENYSMVPNYGPAPPCRCQQQGQGYLITEKDLEHSCVAKYKDLKQYDFPSIFVIFGFCYSIIYLN